MQKDFDERNNKKKTIHVDTTTPFYVPIGSITGRESSVNLSQIRLIDSKRLIKKVATLDVATFVKIQERLKEILF